MQKQVNKEKRKFEYINQINSCFIREEKREKVFLNAQIALKWKSKYQIVSKRLNIHWVIVAVIHCLEASFRFDTYLHNGDKLGKPTVNVPAGILFHDWHEAAVHALERRKILNTIGMSIEEILFMLEGYNGMGYYYKGKPSQYLWSFTNIEQPGRYVADHVWSDKAMSQQVGAMALILEIAKFDEETLQLLHNREHIILADT